MKLLFMNNIGVNVDSANLMYYYYLRNFYSNEVWDLSPIYHKTGTVTNIEEANAVQTIEEFDLKLFEASRKDAIVILTNMVLPAWYLISPIVKKYNIPVIGTQKNNFLNILGDALALDFSIKMPVGMRIKKILLKLKAVRMLKNRIRYGGTKFDYLISGYNSNPEEAVHFIQGHNPKYEEYLANRDSDSPCEYKYIVFIDTALCYHPIDFADPDPSFDAKHYLNQLNSYFDLLENKYGIPVVVSLHPCSYGHIDKDDFGNRLVSYGMTAKLIQHAELVVAHYSTSLINAVMAKKPVIIISSNEIETSLRKGQQLYAFAFAKLCCFQIDSLDAPRLPDYFVNDIKYNQFIYRYLINKARESEPNSEIVLSLIESFENK